MSRANEGWIAKLPRTLEEFAARIGEPAFAEVRAFYRISSSRAVRMMFDETGWVEASRILQAERHSIEQQTLLFVQSRHLGHEAVLNPFRGRRSGRSVLSNAAGIIDQELAEKGCAWCDRSRWHVAQTGRLIEEFGEVRSRDGRFRAGPNWARLSTVSGIAYGDEDTHNLFRLSREDFTALFAIASEYRSRARLYQPSLRYFVCFLNGGPRSASSVAHAHIQILGREDAHFGIAEQVVRCCASDYFTRVGGIHEAIGLAHFRGNVRAWANLCPVKERDVTVLSSDLIGGAGAVFDILQALQQSGTTSFSLAAILKPEGDTGDRRFEKWPGVVWRLVDRGDIGAAHADVGSLELLCGTAGIAADPWSVASVIQGS